MLNRLTVSTLLQAVILTTAFCIVLGFSLTAWDSWERLQLTNRMAVVADASANMFKAMDRLRSDRSTTNRLLNSDQPLDGEMDKYLRGLRDVEMPAMSHALEVLPSIAFAQQQILVPEFDRLLKTVVAEQKEFWEEIAKPKASRRAALGKEYMDTETALLATLDKISGVLAAEINHQDATIDQLLMIKQTAWLLRNTAGETSLLVSNGLAAGKLTPENQQAYTKLAGGIEIAWKALETATGGMKLPAALSAAIDANKSAYFDPQYLALRDRLLTALVAGEKPELTANQWSPLTVARLSAAVGVADAALAAAQEHIAAQHSLALRSLLLQLAFLIAAVALTCGAMLMVTRRVIKPLHNMRDAMLKVAAGDLAVDTGYADRGDEIGALAGALETFKQQANDKLRIEAQERERNAGAAARQRAIEAYVGEFEGMVRQTLQQLGDASSQMRTTSSGLSTVSRQTNKRVEVAEKASNEASMSVESVASASEELSASINDISQQAAHAAGIASRAVSQASETDGTVQGTGKIGGADRRSGRPHQYHCRPDQPACAERHHRGRPRRRGGQRLCGGRLRSQIARQPDRESHRGNLRADRRHPEGGGRRHRRHQGHRQHHRRGQRGRDRDRGGRPTARCGDAGDHAQHAICVAGHQERLRQHHRRQGGCRCRSGRRGERQRGLQDAGNPEPAARQPSDGIPRQDPRRLIF